MNEYMRVAFDEARTGMRLGKGGPFGAVIVKDGEILGAASNEVLSTNDPTAHAEILAIRRACGKLQSHDLSGCALFATGEPCPMCLSAIIWANIRKIYYASAACEAEKIGFRDGMIYRYLRDGEGPVLEARQIDRAEGLALYEEYRQSDHMIY
ncbi:MAG: nucleoside deaminase [Clostridiales bacterium]|nr:nucleoside deaminase [Clostridiales bacterium]